jgi:hypothetical protein
VTRFGKFLTSLTAISRRLIAYPYLFAFKQLIEDSLSRCIACDAITRITISITPVRNDLDEKERDISQLSGTTRSTHTTRPEPPLMMYHP